MKTGKTFLQCKAEVTEDAKIKVILSKQIYDRDGEILDIAGCDLENFKKNPIMLWGHRMYGDIEDVVGKWVGIIKEVVDGVPALTAIAEFADHPKAQYLQRMVRQGIISTVSVGFMPRDFDADTRTITDWEMLETSFVPVPANVEAVVTSKGLTDDVVKEVEKQFDDEVWKKLLTYEKIRPKLKLYRKLFMSKGLCDILDYEKTGNELVDIKNIYEIIAELTKHQETPDVPQEKQENLANQEELDLIKREMLSLRDSLKGL